MYVSSAMNLTVAIDTLYCWFIFTISAHFRILRNKLKAIAESLEAPNHQGFAEEVANFVCYHIKVIEFCSQLNNVLGPILFLEVTMSCLQMSFVIYTLQNDHDLSNMPFNFMVFVAMTMQLVIYCFGGEKLMDEVISIYK